MDNHEDGTGINEAYERASKFLSGDRAFLVPPAGTRGYELPDMEGAEVLPLSDSLNHPNITVYDKGGRGNALVIARQNRKFKLKINISSGAKDNLVVVGRDSQVHAELDIRGTDGTIVIGDRADWESIFYARLSSARGFFFLGARSKANGLRVTVEGDGRSAIIGEDCMFAFDTSLRTSDLHSIVQLDTDVWLNQPENVLIEPHVWLGQEGLVLKGTRVGLGSIVAARAVVTRDVPRFCIVGGIPAKIIKSDVSWDVKVTPRKELMKKLKDAYGDLLK